MKLLNVFTLPIGFVISMATVMAWAVTNLGFVH